MVQVRDFRVSNGKKAIGIRAFARLCRKPQGKALSVLPKMKLKELVFLHADDKICESVKLKLSDILNGRIKRMQIREFLSKCREIPKLREFSLQKDKFSIKAL